MGANHVQISQETRKRPRLVESMGRSSNHPVKNRSPSLYVYKTIPDTSERRSIVALDAEGEIYVWLDKRPFKVEELEAFSRSGNPPEPTKIGGVTFYYVGPGGGGVFYPDDYFF